MGVRRDGALAVGCCVLFVATLALVEASLSIPAVALGGLGTVAFELLAARDPDAVRRRWERPAVQAGAVALAIAAAAVGAAVAPSRVLSAGIGALAAYLAFLSVVVATRRR